MKIGNFKVTVWNGGVPVAVYHVENNIVFAESETNGYFFFIDDKLVRVSGTVTIEQQ